MYVYTKSTDGWYVVGFYSPNGEWHHETYHTEAEAAANRVHWLNGGENTPPKPSINMHTSVIGGT